MLLALPVLSQEPSHYYWGKFTRADTLRGMLTPLRTCYDVTYYHPDIRINPADNTIKGSKDVADMWIHESFADYAEALYVEYNWGRKASLDYINAKKQNVRNQRPIIGPYNVNHSGDEDMYDKGQLVLNTLRDVINNDSLWFSILRGIQKKYYHQTVTAEDITNYINIATGENYDYFFDQYLRYPNIPELIAIVQQKGSETTVMYKWNADVKDFHMPIKVTTTKNEFEFIYPTEKWQMSKLNNLDPEDFKIAGNLFYCKTNIHRSYIDPNSTIQIDSIFGK